MSQPEVNDDPILDIRQAIVRAIDERTLGGKSVTDMIVDALPDFFRQPLMPATLPIVQPSELVNGLTYWITRERFSCVRIFYESQIELWQTWKIHGPIQRPPEDG